MDVESDLKRPAENSPVGEAPLKKAKLDDELFSKIATQIDFWFNDSNFRTDKFLRAESSKDDGWVQLEVLAKFQRMKTLTQEVPVMASAVSRCKMVQLSEDRLKVRRKTPLPEQDTSEERTVFVEGFPSTEGVTIESVSNAFSGFGPVAAVRLQFDHSKVFKKECLVEFETEEGSSKAVAVKEVEYGGAKLQIISKASFLQRAQQEKEAAKQKKEKDAEDAKKKKLEESGDVFQPGLLLELSGVPADYPRDDVKAFFSKFGRVRYVDAKGDDKVIIVRFFEAQSVTSALEKLVAKEVTFAGALIEGRSLEGEQETAYWARIEPFFLKEDRGGGGGKRGGKRGGRGGRGRADNRKGGRR